MLPNHREYTLRNRKKDVTMKDEDVYVYVCAKWKGKILHEDLLVGRVMYWKGRQTWAPPAA